jgi:two-component sensor histidine kinase
LLSGQHYLTAVVDGKTISRQKINYFTEQVVSDTNGSIWVVTRAGELIMFETKPGNPDKYFEQKLSFTKELSGINPRAFTFDRNNLFLIGSRSSGLYAFRLVDGILTQQFHLTSAAGLSDDFISHLAVDLDNNIWACSPSGLDKISIKNGVPVIENITKQNNIYQSVGKVVIDKNNTAWALLTNGLIKITPENREPTGYSPTLIVSMIKAGKDTMMRKTQTALTHRQNNLSFYFAATSFLDEKQVRYSYQLLGGSNDQWSEPSNNASVSFIDLHPGEYTLKVKANFPAGSYPEQIIQYTFSILPPWWQTWWFRSVAGVLMIGLLIFFMRFYYKRKLEKQKTILEKQQAIEKERTRIATDMHDDLGAGLSRIKFLSETIGIKQQQQQNVEEEISSIRNYSHEMIDKMGEIVWALNEKNDTLSDLLAYTRAYAVEYLSQNGIKCIVETPEMFPQTFLSGEFRRNIYLTVKEALHNVVKHAQASKVIIKINVDQHLKFQIKDDGTGFEKSSVRLFSNGLSNMESRIKDLGGRLEIKSEIGTDISIKVPLPA